MNEKILTQWIADLRSKKYVPGDSSLRYWSNGVIKCDWRGVLCDQYLSEKLLHWSKGRGKPTRFLCCGSENIVPEEVKKWAGWDRKFESFIAVLIVDVIKLHLNFEMIAQRLENYGKK